RVRLFPRWAEVRTGYRSGGHRAPGKPGRVLAERQVAAEAGRSGRDHDAQHGQRRGADEVPARRASAEYGRSWRPDTHLTHFLGPVGSPLPGACRARSRRAPPLSIQGAPGESKTLPLAAENSCRAASRRVGARRQPCPGAQTEALVTALRVAVITPFLDKRHGTERCIAEQVERLARDHGWSVHIYSQRVEDVALDDGRIAWHRVPTIPGPYIMNYLWWFGANHLVRRQDERRGARYDVVYSPGINCLDADAISVHIVFGGFVSRVREGLQLRRNPIPTWPRLVHRRLYYRLIVALERLVYGRADAAPG